MVYLFLADGFEEVEALTPLDYLRRTDGVVVKTVALNKDKIVTGAHDIKVMADMYIEDIEDYADIEMIVLPGGMPGTVNLENNDKIQDMVSHCYDNDKYIGAICAAPSILGHKGLLKDKNATCYVGFEKELLGATATGKEVEVAGKIITARGAGVANQFAFALIENLKGKDVAEKIKKAVLY